MQLKPITAIAVPMLLVVVSLSIAGCTTLITNHTSSPTITSPSASPTQVTNNSWLEHLPIEHGMRVAVSAMRLPNQIGTKEPQPNYKFVAYNCTVQNINASDRPVSIDYFTAQDTRSNSYNCSDVSNDLTISNFKGSAHSQPGDILGGIVIFEVPRDASVLSITYFDGSTRIVSTVLPV
jgi:Domain of unknown function (DUF4352)